LTLSKHFIEQWRRYFNEDPPPAQRVLQIINRSIWLQRCKLLYEADGTPYKQLGTYWDPRGGMIIKVDWDSNKAVTIITEKTKGKQRGTRRKSGPEGGRPKEADI